MSIFKIIVAGGRDFNDYELVRNSLDRLLSNKSDEVEVVSGKARGADSLGERYASERGLAVTEFPADWGTHGRAAGPIRNGEMAHYADALVAFWDGKSAGTRSMINLAEKSGLAVRVVRY